MTVDRYAVVGNPVEHSLSPQIHEAFAAQTHQSIRYTRVLLPVDGFVNGARDFFANGGCGLNVTLPFKRDAFAWVDEHDAAAQTAVAVNTILPSENGFVGCNTDGVGLMVDLQQNLQLNLASSKVLVIGAGGAAQGVLAPLLMAGPSQITLANRTLARAQGLAEQFSATAKAQRVLLVATDLDAPGVDFDLVINASSASIAGVGALVPAAAVRSAVCYDMMYGQQTPFCEFAVQAGAMTCYDGLGMLVEQAAAAFRLWRNQAVDTAPVLDQLRSQGLGRTLT